MHKFDIKNVEKLDNQERRRNMPPEETLAKFDIKDDGTLLDLGCGIGYFTIPAAKLLKNNKVIGIDIIPEILDMARKRAEGIGNMEFRASKDYSFPVEDNSIKYVLISNVIHEVEDKARFLNEVGIVLREDGYLLVIDWDKKEMRMGPPCHERISRNEMIELCSKSGYRLIGSTQTSPTHYGLKFEKVSAHELYTFLKYIFLQHLLHLF